MAISLIIRTDFNKLTIYNSLLNQVVRIITVFLQDIGCGIGGPGRVIARHTGSTVTGLNISDYQIKRAKALTEKAGLQDKCFYQQVLRVRSLLLH